MLGLGIFAAAFALYGLVAGRAERLGISRALVFVIAGAPSRPSGGLSRSRRIGPPDCCCRSEVALALVLFADASRMGLDRFAATPRWLCGLSDRACWQRPGWGRYSRRAC